MRARLLSSASHGVLRGIWLSDYSACHPLFVRN